jgi:hypothetical protein
MVTNAPPIAQERRIEPLRSEIVPVGGKDADRRIASGPVVVTLTISSRCQLRVVADGNEILGRTTSRARRCRSNSATSCRCWATTPGGKFSINGGAGRLLGEPGDVLSTRIGAMTTRTSDTLPIWQADSRTMLDSSGGELRVVRMMAARGALAPRPIEQIGILMHSPRW